MSFVTIECHTLSSVVSECLSYEAAQVVSHSPSLQGGGHGVCVYKTRKRQAINVSVTRARQETRAERGHRATLLSPSWTLLPK
jgi:ribosomal protein L21